MISFQSWIQRTTELFKTAVPIDDSLRVLRELLQKGYDEVVWINSEGPCPKCVPLHHKQWYIKDFIAGLHHEAPIFEHSHPGCRCQLVARGPNLPDVVVKSF